LWRGPKRVPTEAKHPFLKCDGYHSTKITFPNPKGGGAFLLKTAPFISLEMGRIPVVLKLYLLLFITLKPRAE